MGARLRGVSRLSGRVGSVPRASGRVAGLLAAFGGAGASRLPKATSRNSRETRACEYQRRFLRGGPCRPATAVSCTASATARAKSANLGRSQTEGPGSTGISSARLGGFPIPPARGKDLEETGAIPRVGQAHPRVPGTSLSRGPAAPVSVLLPCSRQERLDRGGLARRAAPE